MTRFTLKTTTLKSVDLTVHGLSLNEIVQVLEIHRPALETLFDKFSGKGFAEITDVQFSEAASSMIKSFPGLAAQIIALAGDATEAFEEVVRFPAGASLEALECIAELTFVGTSPKKLWALIAEVFNTRVGATETISP